MKILGIYGSPRAGGNTDILLGRFLEGAAAKGAEVIPLYLREKSFSPCLEIYACTKGGECCLRDDMEQIYPLLREAEVIALASPIFFYGVGAQAKAMIDRCQSFWVEKYLLKRPIRPSGQRGKGIFLSVAGSRGERAFEGALLTVKYFFDCLEVDLYRSLLYRKIDGKGEIRNHPTALEEAFSLGTEVAGEATMAPGAGTQEVAGWERLESPSPWLGILADSHDHLSLLKKAVEICNQSRVGLILHAGDYVAPFSMAPLEELKAPYLGVFGNNDGEKMGLQNRSEGRLRPGPRFLQVNGQSILLIHDLQGGYPQGPSGRTLRLLVHGHTHRPEIRREGSTLLFNPGEVGGWLTGRATMGLFHLKTMEAKIIDLAP